MIFCDFIEMARFYREKSRKNEKYFVQTWPYYASVHVYVTGSQNPKPHCSWVSFSPRWQISEFSIFQSQGGGAIAAPPPCSYATARESFRLKLKCYSFTRKRVGTRKGIEGMYIYMYVLYGPPYTSKLRLLCHMKNIYYLFPCVFRVVW